MFIKFSLILTIAAEFNLCGQQLIMRNTMNYQTPDSNLKLFNTGEI